MLLYALCCLPLLANALTDNEKRQFIGGICALPGCQSPCGQVNLTNDVDTSTTEEDMDILRLTANGIPNHVAYKVSYLLDYRLKTIFNRIIR